MSITPIRTLSATAEFYLNNTKVAEYADTDKIISFDVQRVGEDSKFFGFGICQRLNLKLIDKERALAYTTSHSIKITITDNSANTFTFPYFWISEIHRDEKTNQLSITAYDLIYKASARTYSELTITKPYTIAELLPSIGTLLGVEVNEVGEAFDLSYIEGANYEGTETIREVLDDIAEATTTIYYLDKNNKLTFTQLDKNAEPTFTIDKSLYFELTTSSNKRLQTICSATELGDNVSVSTTSIGSTQYLRDNPFLELREDIATILNSAIERVGNLTIGIFNCKWRGMPLEVGSKIALVDKDNNNFISYLLNDTIEYNGGLIEKTLWKYDENTTETESNPTSLGDLLKQTYARVDKQNKTIELVVKKNEELEQKTSSIQLSADAIDMEVKKNQQITNGKIDDLNTSLQEVEKKVNTSISAEDVKILIQQNAGTADSVQTQTGFTFNQDGLNITKSGSDFSTVIDEDGMIIKNKSKVMLEVNNMGVDAINLTASQYLRVGNTRFEDYKNKRRTGAFWVGRIN